METEAMAVREQRWLQAVCEAANSGLTKAQWCEQNEVSKASFYLWSKLLREKALQSQKAQLEFARLSMLPQKECKAVKAYSTQKHSGIAANTNVEFQNNTACKNFVLHTSEITLEIPPNAKSEEITQIL
ncbi:MAG: hypothetical protein RR612_10970 [Oscillospiraceae bacterium]